MIAPLLDTSAGETAASLVAALVVGGAFGWTLERAGLGSARKLSARLAGRARVSIERGDDASARTRLLYALAGGTVMAIGARLARGCTSGLGLTGGATLSAGAWLFVCAAFAAAFAAAPLARRVWR